MGRANESEIEIDGEISKALIGSDAMISMMNKEYCDEHEYEIQPLDWLVPIEGSGGEDVPYLGYNVVRMQIPGIKSFDQDVFMLVSHITTSYQKRVPIQVGRIIYQIGKSLMEEELKSLSQSWKLACRSTILSKSSQVSDKEFDLDQVKGKVVVMKKVVVPAFQMLIVKGLMKVTRHQKHVHVLVEPSPKCKNIFVPGNTTKLKLGGWRADVVLWNLSGRDIILESHTEVGIFSAANKVPPILAPDMLEGNVQDDENDASVQCLSAQAELPESELRQTGIDPEEILQKVDLLGTTDWDPTEWQEAYNLICKYVCIFSLNDLYFDKTSIIKHSIKLTDPTPFKEWYRCIPSRMYEEVKAHIQEILDMGAICPSNSPWVSSVVLV